MDVAALEDLVTLKAAVEDIDIENRQIRNISGILRRLLIDNDIQNVSRKYIPKITIQTPDNNEIYRSSRKSPFLFFQSCGCKIRGIWMRAIIAEYGSVPRQLEFNPGTTVDLKINNFLRQNVFCFKGEWVSRSDVIKYVANKASGVHSDTKRGGPYKILDYIRNALTISVEDERLETTLNIDNIEFPNDEFKFSSKSVDPVFLELLAATHFFLDSSDVHSLLQELRKTYVE